MLAFIVLDGHEQLDFIVRHIRRFQKASQHVVEQTLLGGDRQNEAVEVYPEVFPSD